ncbi:13348_t:CDS:2, partial [Racocetra persica]
MKGTKAEVWKQLEEAQKKVQELEKTNSALLKEKSDFLVKQKVASLEELATKIKNSAKEKQQAQEKIDNLKERVRALQSDKQDLLKRVENAATTDQSSQTDLTNTGILELLRKQLTQQPQSSTIKEAILAKILEEKKQEISRLEQELAALGEQLDVNLEIRLKALGADAAKNKQITQLQAEIQDLTQYGSTLIEQKENKIKALIIQNTGLKTQLELRRDGFRTIQL